MVLLGQECCDVNRNSLIDMIVSSTKIFRESILTLPIFKIPLRDTQRLSEHLKNSVFMGESFLRIKVSEVAGVRTLMKHEKLLICDDIILAKYCQSYHHFSN